ncbi:6552_t:CDS:2, partial [Dentiscutata erythropus]
REETPDDQKKQMIRKINAAKKYYDDLANSSQSTNEISNNQVRDYQFDGASQSELNIIPVQTQSVQRRTRTTHNLAQSIIDNFNPLIISKKNVISGRHMLQRMSICCEHCQAVRWQMESSTNCCRNGKVGLAPLVFAFISMGASIDPHLANSANGVYTYHVQGAIYHQIGSMLSAENCTPKFSQIYIYDGNFEAELSYRHNVFPTLDTFLLANIQYELHMHNPFAQVFHSAGQFVRE